VNADADDASEDNLAAEFLSDGQPFFMSSGFDQVIDGAECPECEGCADAEQSGSGRQGPAWYHKKPANEGEKNQDSTHSGGSGFSGMQSIELRGIAVNAFLKIAAEPADDERSSEQASGEGDDRAEGD
jgi:hypothetical protein